MRKFAVFSISDSGAKVQLGVIDLGEDNLFGSGIDETENLNLTALYEMEKASFIPPSPFTRYEFFWTDDSFCVITDRILKRHTHTLQEER